jgi:tetratricopeptide (TPR) repeat protein
MGSAAIKLPPAVGELLRSKRKEKGLTLGQVTERLNELGETIAPSTLSRIETNGLDPGVRRLYLLLELYEVPSHLIGDLIQLESMAERPELSRSTDLEVLHREGLDNLRKGNMAGALGCLFAVRQYVPDSDETRVLRQRTTVAFATTARNLGKLRLTMKIVEDLLLEPPDRSLIVAVLTLAASVWRGLGSHDAALGFVRQAESYLGAGGLEETAWVTHQKAALLVDVGALPEAEKSLRQALDAYRRLEDPYGEVRALLVRVQLLDKRGDVDGAIRCTRRVMRMSESHGLKRGVAYSRIMLAPLLLKTGRVADAIETLHSAQRVTLSLDDRNAEFLVHYHLWKAHLAEGDSSRAELELSLATQYLAFVDFRTPENEEVRRIQEQQRRGR